MLWILRYVFIEIKEFKKHLESQNCFITDKGKDKSKSVAKIESHEFETFIFLKK